MKCYYCGNNEAEYRFLVNYMGNIGDIRLCGECFATLSQMAGPILSQLRERLQERLSFSEELRAMMNWEPGKEKKDISPVDFFRWTENELGGTSPKQPVTEPEEDFLLPDEENEFKRRRRLNELRERMSLAITAEDYEAAACLRDEICGLEKDGVGIGTPQQP